MLVCVVGRNQLSSHQKLGQAHDSADIFSQERALKISEGKIFIQRLLLFARKMNRQLGLSHGLDQFFLFSIWGRTIHKDKNNKKSPTADTKPNQKRLVIM